MAKNKIDELNLRIEDVVTEFVQQRLYPNKTSADLDPIQKKFLERQAQETINEIISAKNSENTKKYPSLLKNKINDILSQKNDIPSYINQSPQLSETEVKKFSNLIANSITQINELKKQKNAEIERENKKIQQEEAKAVSAFEKRLAKAKSKQDKTQNKNNSLLKRLSTSLKQVATQSIKELKQNSLFSKKDPRIKLLQEEIKYLESKEPKVKNPYKKLRDDNFKKLEKLVDDFRKMVKPEESEKDRKVTNGAMAAAIHAGLENLDKQDMTAQAQTKLEAAIKFYVEDFEGKIKVDFKTDPPDFKSELAQKMVDKACEIAILEQKGKKLTTAKNNPDKAIKERKDKIASITKEQAEAIGQDTKEKSAQTLPRRQSTVKKITNALRGL